MQLLSTNYELSEYEKESAPKLDPIFLVIGNEILRCTYGLKLTWFLLKEKRVRDKNMIKKFVIEKDDPRCSDIEVYKKEKDLIAIKAAYAMMHISEKQAQDLFWALKEILNMQIN